MIKIHPAFSHQLFFEPSRKFSICHRISKKRKRKRKKEINLFINPDSNKRINIQIQGLMPTILTYMFF